MAALALAGDDLARAASMRQSLSASGRRSFKGLIQHPPDAFSHSGREDDEEELQWAAIERLPTYDRIRKSVLNQVLDDGKVKASEIDVTKLGKHERNQLMNWILNAVDEDNNKFLEKLRSRLDKVGVQIPKIEIRFEHLSVDGDVQCGSRSLPTLLNFTMNAIESVLGLIRLAPSKKRKIEILKDINGIVRPSRMTLLLGPPSSGRTTFLLALAGKLDDELRKRGKVTYCGHEFHEFVPRRTCAYISQHDLHHGEMTVRETLDFSGRCLGVGARYELLAELSRREKEAGIKPDPEIDAFMKATSVSGQKSSLVTDYVLKLIGLDICSNTMVGDAMRRGISGGQKRRVTSGEMLVGTAKAFYMDEISTGLDSSTTFQIVKYMRQLVHIMDVSMIISLLQPAPETYDLFDDIILMSEGQIVYQGPRQNILEFFQHMGFKCPERKGVADFLQEVTSKKDQEQYWFEKDKPYKYISVPEFAEAFNSFHIGQKLAEELSVPYDKSKTHPAALVKKKYGISNKELFVACFAREKLLMKRSAFVYIFKTVQITITAILTFTVFFRTTMPYGHLTDAGKWFGVLFFSLMTLMFNGMAEMAMMVFRLPVFFKQRDFLLFPAWAFGLPIYILRIPVSLVESAIWVILTYYTVGYAPSAGRFFKQFLTLFSVHQMALGLFRFMAAVGRTQVVAFTLGMFTLLTIYVLGGFIVAKDDLHPAIAWAYYLSPLSWGQNAMVMNEFLDDRWSAPNPDPRFNQPTVGKLILHSRSFYTEEIWFWYCIAALLGFSVFFNVAFVLALTYLGPISNSKTAVVPDEEKKIPESSDETKKGMALPFQPMSLVFNHMNYYVDMPAEMKAKGIEGDRLQLLKDISGAFRPGVLTALMGVSGAGKTTLMDVLAGRKTGGYIDGDINISGYPKKQETFARISGYCEQNDIHSPSLTIYESVLYSAWLRLPTEVKTDQRKMFAEEVLELVELNPLRNSLVGLPGVNGLSTEQRKRLTIAVELVANPSIIFMDEPTSGLDARAAAIVMRTVRNTVDTGRTVVCTIHQPSIDIFEAFDDLVLMKRGGRVIYSGPLGRQSLKLIEYFEAIPGVAKIKDGYNPATWMLEVTTLGVESQLNVDFADIYAKSSLYERNQEVIKELSTPIPGSKDLHFQSKYSQPFITQCKACFWKQYWSYWRNPHYNAVRLLQTAVIGIIFGVIFYGKGQKTSKQQDLQNLMGAIYSSVLFIGSSNANAVQSIVDVERTVSYRERAAGMYSSLPFAFTQILIETIYVAVQTILYALILYPMIGFKMNLVKFLWFWYLLYTSFLYYTAYGMMIMSLTPGVQISAVFSSFFTNFWNLFSGFLIPRTQIPIWWRWYYWASPVAWTINGLVTSQLGDLTSPVEVPGSGSMAVKDYLKISYDYDYDFLPVIAIMQLVFVFIFAFVYALGIKFLNFQTR